MKDSTKLKLIKVLFVILILIIFIIVEAFFFAPTRLKVNYRNISSNEIPASFDEFSICFLSDLHYGTTYTEDNIYDLVNKVNLLQADIVIFGGDLVDSLTKRETDMNILAYAFSDIDANYGKFAVLGNHDYENKTTTEKVVSTLEYAGFEIITNTSMRIHNGTSDSIRLIGLDSSLLGTPNVTKAFDEVRSSDFSILVTHTPDNVLNCNTSLIDLQLSGHSHGSQIYIPFISTLILPPGSKIYYRGIYTLDDGTMIYVTTGVGTTQIQARLFTNPEIVLYRLHHEE